MAPSTLVSSYFLANHRSTAIEIANLPLGVRTELSDDIPDLNMYDMIRIGKESGDHAAGFNIAEKVTISICSMLP